MAVLVGRVLMITGLFLALFLPSSTQASSPIASDFIEIEEIVVTGRRPGPPLWKVQQGDHILWIFGVIDPIPTRFEWDESSVQFIMSESKAILMPPSVNASISNPIQFVRLLSKLRKIQRLPRGTQLSDVIATSLHQQLVQVLQINKIEQSGYQRLRPMHAANKLREDALRKAGLEAPQKIYKRIRKMARRAGLDVVEPLVDYDAKAALTAIDSVADDHQIQCLATTLEALLNDTKAAAVRADIWSNGNRAELMLLDYPQPDRACGANLYNNTALHAAVEEAKARWLDHAVEHLHTHDVTFAVLPIWELIAGEGLLKRLKHYLQSENFTAPE